MYRLSTETLLQAWETGRALHPVDQALLLLAAAEPTADLTDLSRLSIGQRGLAEIGVLQFVTLATVGYGDMLAVTAWVRSLATFEGMVGVLYVALLMGG
ncbi:MAG: potassium channel family protein [Marmoricola sp.]